MADERLKKDANYVSVIGGITNNAAEDVSQVRVNPTTKRVLVEPSALDYSTDSVRIIDGWNIPTYDYIGLSYTGTDLTEVLYRTGGSTGTAVGTLTLAYSTGTLTSVTLDT